MAATKILLVEDDEILITIMLMVEESILDSTPA